MAASVRFAFQRGGPLDLLRSGDAAAYRVPSVPLAGLVRDMRIVAFIGAWLGVNMLVGLGGLAMPGVEQAVAWQAHIGGFLAGLLLFDLFDPVDAPQPESPREPTENGSGGENLSPPQ
jgi:membrane associated rhomboid family serine protease